MLPLYQHIGYFTCTIKVNGTNSFTFPWICALESYFSSSSSKIPHYTTDQKENSQTQSNHTYIEFKKMCSLTQISADRKLI